MGTDIHGWVEVKRYLWVEEAPEKAEGLGLSPWAGVVDVGSLLGRNYGMFGMLFLPERGLFTPLAARRGLPADLSQRVLEDRRRIEELGLTNTADDHCHTWIGWDELRAIDWDETVTVPERRILYRRGEDGRLSLTGDLGGPRSPAPTEADLTWPEGEWGVLPGRAVAWREMLDDDWECIFRMMEALAAVYGPQQVRLVVWFDG